MGAEAICLRVWTVRCAGRKKKSFCGALATPLYRPTDSRRARRCVQEMWEVEPCRIVSEEGSYRTHGTVRWGPRAPSFYSHAAGACLAGRGVNTRNAQGSYLIKPYMS